jgi:uncharacterized protein (DUF2062 family)
MNPRRWLHEHSLKLLAIRDTPEAIAGGVAIGIFFGFSPLFGLKTVLSIFFAWLTRSNILAAVLAATLHDEALPLMPLVYRFEYALGYLILSQPHHWPPPMFKAHWEGLHWSSWLTISKVGQQLLLGFFICGAPLAAIAYFVTKPMVIRYHRKHPRPPDSKDAAV